MKSMPVRRGAAARFLGEEIEKLVFQVRFLHKSIAKQRKQSQQDETTIEKQKATIKKLKAELKAMKAMPSRKPMNTMPYLEIIIWQNGDWAWSLAEPGTGAKKAAKAMKTMKAIRTPSRWMEGPPVDNVSKDRGCRSGGVVPQPLARRMLAADIARRFHESYIQPILNYVSQRKKSRQWSSEQAAVFFGRKKVKRC